MMDRFVRHGRALAVLVLALVGISSPARSQLPEVRLADPFPRLDFPPLTGLVTAPDGRLYVLGKAGRIWSFPNDHTVEQPTLALDIRDRVNPGDLELGLLGLAFDPDYATNGYVYLDYTTGTVDVDLRTRVSRFTRLPGEAGVLDPDSETIVFELAQPYSGHNGGAILFGPEEGPSGERYLYVTLGDGGSGNDPHNNGQRLDTPYGAVLRLSTTGSGQPLECLEGGFATVPADNPFAAGPGGACDEIWAYGLRNPWRMSFDAPSARFWVGDVGQFIWEEVNILERGGNFGWRPYEGTWCLIGPCSPSGKTFPVWAYRHFEGRCSVIGGYVYRGRSMPELDGRYLVGDYCTGTVWALREDTPDTWVADSLTTSPGLGLTSFGTDGEGEIYAIHTSGEVLRLERTPPVAAETPAGVRPAGLTLAGPNPTRGRTTVRLQHDGPAQLFLLDPRGRRLAVLFDGMLSALRATSVGVDATALPPGTYFVQLVAPGRRETLPLVVAR